MNNSKSTTVKVIETKNQSDLSKAQKSFNRLIKQIETKRKQLKAWQDLIPEYQKKYVADFAPLLPDFNGRRIEMVKVFDNAFSGKGLNKTEKAKISDIICNVIEELPSENDENNELKQIYSKHSGCDIDAKEGQNKDLMKSMLEKVFGIDIENDADFNSPEEMMAHASKQAQQKFFQDEQKEEELRTKRKKSAKTLAKEMKLKEEAQNVSQSIREVYRKLVSALHPDHEQDTEEQERKTALMKRVNVVYSNKDLLGLLELQLEVEQIDQSKINTISDDKLKYYNKVLTEQRDELQTEIYSVEMSFRMHFNYSPQESVSPTTAMSYLQNDIQALKQDIDILSDELESFDDIKNIKAWLKDYRIEPNPLVSQDLLDAMFYSLRTRS